jgi:hypothetical protein
MYTREALTAKAIEAGHSAADVEAAWQRIDEIDSRARRASGEGTGRPSLGTFLLIGVVLIMYGYTAYLGIGGISWMALHPGRARSLTASILTGVYVIAMVLGLAYSVVRLYRAPSLNIGAEAIATALAISIGILFGINGVCVVSVVGAGIAGTL